MKFTYVLSVIIVYICVFGYHFLQAQPLDNGPNTGIRLTRSPTKNHKPFLGGLFQFGGNKPTGHGPQGVVNNNYITNINNYGPGGHGGHGQEASFAGSAAFAGGHGAQAQSQAAAFSLGPVGAAFSQSQAQGGHSKNGLFDLFDY